MGIWRHCLARPSPLFLSGTAFIQTYLSPLTWPNQKDPPASFRIPVCSKRALLCACDTASLGIWVKSLVFSFYKNSAHADGLYPLKARLVHVPIKPRKKILKAICLDRDVIPQRFFGFASVTCQDRAHNPFVLGERVLYTIE